MNRFKRNLLIGYTVSLVLLVISSVASYISIQNLMSSSEMVRHTNEVIQLLNNVELAAKDGEAGQRGYLLTGEERFLTPYQGAYERGLASLNKVQESTIDNNDQQKIVQELKEAFEMRFTTMQDVINQRNTTGQIDLAKMETGRRYMQKIRSTIGVMKDKEQALLNERTKEQNRFASLTPVMIIIAAMLSFFITVISFLRVNADFEKRSIMQKELETKDEEIGSRIRIIKSIADKIAAGNYAVRVDDAGQDVLGSIGHSLNKMAQSLQHAFDDLQQKEWLQTGIAALNEKMIGEKNLDVLSFNVIDFVTNYTNTGIGAFYLVKKETSLSLTASIALDKSTLHKEVQLGEGVAGQAAASGKPVYLDNLPDQAVTVSYAGGQIKPTSIFAVPIFYERILKGVIEINSVEAIKPVVQEFVKAAAYNVGIAIHSARDHERLQNLLEETQTQSEELQSQHSELENINAELEAQSEKLQASEEELKVQHEELMQANGELEERSRLLEEKNELILERNLEIQAKAEALEVSTKYKSEFLANMSHELRTPLNSILLLSRLLSENHEANLSADQIEYAKVIQNSGNGLLTLIDEILDLSKIESGKMDLEKADVPVTEVVKELKALFEPVAQDKGILFEATVAPGADSLIETDKLRLEQILRNLISNALKFTKKGSVSLSVTRQDGIISFAVKDTGIGIPKEKQQSIFEAFQQADGSTRRKYGGTGLGLSISRELAKLLGGEIHLESEEGVGSTFTLNLPVTKGEALLVPQSLLVASAIQPTVEANTPPPAPVWDKKFTTNVIPLAVPDDRATIAKGDKVLLIIEDDTAFARSLQDFARQKGYKVIVAVRGDEGIELAKQFLPLGILLDLQLPVKNGWEVMEALKQNPATKPIPVHMMSSHQEHTKSISKGAVDFINKPMAFEKMGEIIQKIEQALSRHPKKVLIIEENPKHAKALAFFLETFNVTAEIKNDVDEGIQALNQQAVDCVILDMGIPAQQAYNTLEEVKKRPGFENLPIIIFTGKNLSHVEEMRIKQYADSIVIKTAHSYQRILDEVSLFLHLVEENKEDKQPRYKKLGALGEVLKGKTVLIADDDVRNIFSLTKALEGYGMNVLSAIDGKEALRQLAETPKVDIVLMDMMMPEMDGYESTQKIREQHRFKNLPVIAVTAKAMTGDREKCISAGASDYITKPVDIDQLVSLLRVWLYDKV